jgi:calcineurin-like phosphoesterase family protein
MHYYTTQVRDWDESLVSGRLLPAADLGLASDFWLISDTHFFHGNIAGYCGRPRSAQQEMIANWHHLVGLHDQIVHLGDLALGQREQTRERLASLPGEKYLLCGNHDRLSAADYQGLGFTVVPPFCWNVEGWTVSCTHAPHPELVRYPRTLNVHGHIHEKLAPSWQLLNCSVEWTDYAPVRSERLVRERLAGLASAPRAERAVPLSYAEWLARQYGGEILRSDTDRFRDERAQNEARMAFTRYRLDLAADAPKPRRPEAGG